MGAIAMTGFFLLSGYVLNLSYQKIDMTMAKTIKIFYLKRLISIIPLYYAWALINIVINIAIKGSQSALEEILLFPIEALGIQSVFASLFPFSHNGGSWFISCILICYFVFPLILSLTKGIADKSRVIIILILGSVLLWSPLIQIYFQTVSIYANPFFRVFEFVIGILLCQMNEKSEQSIFTIRILRKKLSCILTLAALIIGVCVAYTIGIPGDYMLYSWIALPCFASLLISLGYINFENLQGSTTIKYFSELSFSIFLSQMIVVWTSVKYMMELVGCQSNIANILVSAIICFCIANFFHYVIEKPSAKYLKSKLLK